MTVAKIIIWSVALPCAALGSDVLVNEHPEWRPATEEQRKAIPSQPASMLLDLSLHASGGAGVLLRTRIKGEMSKQTADNTIAGFLGAIREGGMTVTDQSQISVGRLRGICITAKSEGNGNAVGVVSHLVFASRDMYTMTVYGPADMTRSDPLVQQYLSRVAFDPSVVPGNIEAESAYEQGRRIGRMTVGVVKIVVIVGAVTVGIGFVIAAILRRRRRMKPPPLKV